MGSKIQESDFVVECNEGKKIGAPDALSRLREREIRKKIRKEKYQESLYIMELENKRPPIYVRLTLFRCLAYLPRKLPRKSLDETNLNRVDKITCLNYK